MFDAGDERRRLLDGSGEDASRPWAGQWDAVTTLLRPDYDIYQYDDEEDDEEDAVDFGARIPCDEASPEEQQAQVVRLHNLCDRAWASLGEYDGCDEENGQVLQPYYVALEGL